MRKIAPEELKSHMEEEMRVFDGLHPCIRAVLREADTTVHLYPIFRQHPELHREALRSPYDFALKLKAQLKNWSTASHEQAMARVAA